MLKSQNLRSSVLSSALLIALLGASGSAFSQAGNFQLTVNNAVTFTPFFPMGVSDVTPPYTMCRGYQVALRLRYTWRHGFAEQISTEPVGTFYPQFFTQGVSPNPLYLPAAAAGEPIIRLVDTGLISGPVNTAGIKTVTYRGRTLLNYDAVTGQSRTPLTASVNVLIENQFEPSSTRYKEIADDTRFMPTRPWFLWQGDLASTSFRLDVDRCTIQGDGTTPVVDRCSDMAFSPFTQTCGNSDYCNIDSASSHLVNTSLLPDTDYEYRVLGRNTCGVSDEAAATPVSRPNFRTAQACFVGGGNIPDGGALNLDVTTLIRDAGIPNALAPNLRVTVHANHPRVSDLKISLRKTFPVAVGPVILMDRPASIPGGGSCDGPRIQAFFSDGGLFVNGACRGEEPVLRGNIGPIGSLSTFASAKGAGNWRLTVEDSVPNGVAGSVLEWCLSTDLPLIAAPFSQPQIFTDGFEDLGGSL